MLRIESTRVWLAVLAAAGMGVSARAQLLNEDGPNTDLLSSSAVTSGRITLAKEHHELGHILQLDRPEFDYPFQNTGNGLLVIQRVQSTCGCTVPELVKKEYKPGESGVIHVKYDPSAKFGTQLKQIHVVSNDPERPDITLSFKAEVAPVVLLEPRNINLSPVPKGETRTVTLKVTGRTPDFAATYATLTRGEHVSVKILDTKAIEQNGASLRQTELEITLSPNAPVGRLSDNLSIRTTDSREAVVFCPITADIAGDIKTEPSVLAFGVVRPGDPFKGTVRLASRNNKPFKIVNAEVKQPNTAGIKLSFVAEDPANPTVYTLSADGTSPTVAEGVRPAPIQGYIVVATDVERENKLEIPFYVQPRFGGPTTGVGVKPQAPGTAAAGQAPAVAPQAPASAPK